MYSGSSARARSELYVRSARCASKTQVADDRSAPGRGTELNITIIPFPDEGPIEFFTRLQGALREFDAKILMLVVFGTLRGSNAATEALRRVFGPLNWPFMWIEGAPCGNHSIAGAQVFALSGGAVQKILFNGRVTGSVYESGGARHCLSCGIIPRDVRASHGFQAGQTFEGLQELLAQGGFSLADVARTWFYNDQILAWYPEFNRVRTGIYRETRFRSGSLPASTGVSGRTISGAALCAAAWAVQPLNRCVRVIDVASPLQCSATRYGSSFSRATEVQLVGGRRLLISGTASISPDGTTAGHGDCVQQLDFTLEVVAAILRSRGFGFEDATRATAYFKHSTDAALWERCCQRRGVPPLPVVIMRSDICREDLLFELELDAWKTAPVSAQTDSDLSI